MTNGVLGGLARRLRGEGSECPSVDAGNSSPAQAEGTSTHVPALHVAPLRKHIRAGHVSYLLRAGLVAGLLLAGQAGAAGHAAAASPQSGGTLIYAENFGSFDSFIPVVSPAEIVDDEAQVLLYRPLLWIGQDASIEYDRSIAQSISVSKDLTTYTVHLRPDYKWSDGTPVTAADVAYCYNLMKQYGTKYAYYGIGGLPNLVKSFTVDSPTSFTIAMTTPFNPTYFELNGLAQLRPLPSKAWKAYDATYLFNHQTDLNVLSTVDGPYKLTKFVSGQYARFARNTMYSGHQSYLDTYIVQFYSADQAIFAALRTGAVQIGAAPYSLHSSWGQLNNLDTYSYSIFGFDYITLNYRNPATSFFKDVNVRQAMQLAINQPEMNQALYYGNAHSAYSPIPFVPSTYLSPAARAAANPDQYDVTKAASLLDADGWKMSGGVRAKAGQQLAFTLEVFSGQETSVRQAEIIQQDFAKLGIQMSLKQVTFQTGIAQLASKGTGWDAVGIGWIYYPNFYPLGDGLFATTGGSNFGGFSDPKLDATVVEAQTKPGLQGMYDYGDYASKVVPALFLDYPETVIKYQPNVQGVSDFFNPVFGFSPEYLWLKH
jgi:peptide/nickel transport system substrate-binding protein